MIVEYLLMATVAVLVIAAIRTAVTAKSDGVIQRAVNRVNAIPTQ